MTDWIAWEGRRRGKPAGPGHGRFILHYLALSKQAAALLPDTVDYVRISYQRRVVKLTPSSDAPGACRVSRNRRTSGVQISCSGLAAAIGVSPPASGPARLDGDGVSVVIDFSDAPAKAATARRPK